MGLSGQLRSANIRGIAHLSIGTAGAQAVAIGVAPILTRLYAPSDYGALAVFGSSLAIGMSVATGRYDAAVSLPPESPDGERKAITLVKLAILIAMVASLAGLVLLAGFRSAGIDPWFQELGGWAFAIPPAVLVGCVSQTLMAYATRQRQYGRVAQVQPSQRIVSALAQIGLGLRDAGRGGLIFGSIVAPFVGLFLLSRVYREGVRIHSPEPFRSALGEVRASAREYADFPRINLWSSLLNALAWNVQILILGIFFTGGEVGQYSLAVTVASLPSGLIVVGVSQVFQRELASRVQDTAASLALARRVVRSLAMLSVVPFVVLAAFGEPLFAFVFGDQWRTAGAIATAMVPLLWCRFVSTSLSVAFPVYRRPGLLLTWQLVVLAVTSGAFLIGSAAGLSIVTVTWWASSLTAPLYLALIPMAKWVIRQGPPAQARMDPPSGPHSRGLAPENDPT